MFFTAEGVGKWERDRVRDQTLLTSKLTSILKTKIGAMLCEILGHWLFF